MKFVDRKRATHRISAENQGGRRNRDDHGSTRRDVQRSGLECCEAKRLDDQAILSTNTILQITKGLALVFDRACDALNSRDGRK